MSKARRLACAVALLLAAVLVPALSPMAAPEQISFAIAGDFGAGDAADASLAALDASGVDFSVAIGDLDYREVPTPAAWCDYVKARLPRLGPAFPFQLLAGNHEEDTIAQHAACLPDRLGSTTGPGGRYATEYFFDYPPAAPIVRVILVSPGLVIENVAYNYPAGGTRFNWVAGAVDGARVSGIPWVVVGMHKHCTTSSSSSCEIGASLMDMLVAKKVDVVVQGHKHTYQRGKQLALRTGCASASGSYDTDCVVDDGSDGFYTKGRGTIPLINGMFGKGGSSSPGRYYVRAGNGDGFTKFTVTRDRLDAEFVNATTTFRDTYSIVPNQPPVLTDPGSQADDEGDAIRLPIAGADPEGGRLTYSAAGLPPGLTIEPSGTITGTIARGARFASPYAARISAADELGAVGGVEFIWHVSDTTPPAQPSGLVVTRHTTGVHLDWSDGSEPDLAGYDVFRSTAPAGPFQKLNSVRLTTSELFDETAPAGATSWYRIVAADEAGNVSAPLDAGGARSPIVLVGSSVAATTAGALTLPRPAGAVPGDVLVAGVSVQGGVLVLPPAGWTLVAHAWRPPAAAHQAVYTHTVTASDPAAYVFGPFLDATAAAVAVAYRGAIEQPSRVAGRWNPASADITAPSVSPPVASSVQVGFFGIFAAATIAPPAGMLERGEHIAPSGVTIAVADVVVDVSAVGERTAKASDAADNAGQVVVLSPAF